MPKIERDLRAATLSFRGVSFDEKGRLVMPPSPSTGIYRVYLIENPKVDVRVEATSKYGAVLKALHDYSELSNLGLPESSWKAEKVKSQ